MMRAVTAASEGEAKGGRIAARGRGRRALPRRLWRRGRRRERHGTRRGNAAVLLRRDRRRPLPGTALRSSASAGAGSAPSGSTSAGDSCSRAGCSIQLVAVRPAGRRGGGERDSRPGDRLRLADLGRAHPEYPPLGSALPGFTSFVRAAVARYGSGGTFWRQHPELPARRSPTGSSGTSRTPSTSGSPRRTPRAT